MKNYVFDSYAILAFLEDEPGADKVEKKLREVMQAKAQGFMSIIDWGEIFYITMREQGTEKAEEIIELLSHYPLNLVNADQQLTKAAARLKGKYRIAYADCFAAALGQHLKATILTGDPEFKQLENETEILWLP